MWFNERGRYIAIWAPNSAREKLSYDAHGRLDTRFMTDGASDPLPGATGNYAAAAAVTDDIVIEEHENRYKAESLQDTGLLDLVTTRMRHHDASSTGYGVLDDTNSVETYVGYAYDAASRLTKTYNFGSNTSGDYLASGGSEPAASSYDSLDALVTHTGYDDWGRAVSTTDPAGTVTLTKLDALSRLVAVIEAADVMDASKVTWSSTNGRWEVTTLAWLSDDKDRVTSFVYDGLDNITKRTAHFESGTDQTTEYVYGTTLGTGDTASLVSSSSLLLEVHYPDESTGDPGTISAYKVSYAYNKLGELRAMTDQNGTVHLYDRDGLGRLTEDRVDTLGTDIDGTVRRISTTYKKTGLIKKVTSYDDPDAGTALNGVLFEYTGLNQVAKVWQNHDGEASSTGGSECVQYNYADAVPSTGASNYERVDEMIYPTLGTGSSETLSLNYTGAGLDDRISRLTNIELEDDPGTPTLAKWLYLGAGVNARTNYPSATAGTDPLRLDRTVDETGASTAGVYPGYDKYGRVRWQAWVRGTFGTGTGSYPNKTPVMARLYEYDAASNRVRDRDGRPGAIGALPSDRDWYYNYDDLDRLQEAVRGVYDGSTGSYDMIVAPGSEEWSLDVLGNWEGWVTDTGSADPPAYTNADTPQGRTHNAANEITRITHTAPNGLVSTDSEPWYDAAGNYRSNQLAAAGGTRRYTYDAWNRLIKVERWHPTSTYAIAEYEYNGLHWRIERKADTATGAYNGIDEHRLYYYSPSWQLIEERVDAGNDSSIDWVAQQFWGTRYIDDAVARRVDRTKGTGEDYGDDWSDAELFYYLTDALFSVRVVTDDTGLALERIDYTPYGEAMHRWAADYDEDGDVDSADITIFFTNAPVGGPNLEPGDAGYDPDVDADGDGDSADDTDDQGLLSAQALKGALPAGWISDPADTTMADNCIGYAGYRFNLETEQYEVRFRVYDPAIGRWLQRDPLGLAAGMNLYMAFRASPTMYLDPGGTFPFGIIDIRQMGQAVINELAIKVVPSAAMTAARIANRTAPARNLACQIVQLASQNPLFNCLTLIATVSDEFSSNQAVEIADALANLVTTADLVCQGKLGSAALYAALVVVDSTLAPLGGRLGGAIGGAIASSETSNPITIGIGAIVGSRIGEFITESGVWALENALAQGTPLPRQQVCDCITFLNSLGPASPTSYPPPPSPYPVFENADD